MGVRTRSWGKESGGWGLVTESSELEAGSVS